jgi:hypothetical protein
VYVSSNNGTLIHQCIRGINVPFPTVAHPCNELKRLHRARNRTSLVPNLTAFDKMSFHWKMRQLLCKSVYRESWLVPKKGKIICRYSTPLNMNPISRSASENQASDRSRYGEAHSKFFSRACSSPGADIMHNHDSRDLFELNYMMRRARRIVARALG